MARVLACVALLAAPASASLRDLRNDFCGFVNLPLLCASSSLRSNLSTPSECSDSSCCQASSCYAIPGPLFRCRADRGPTVCHAARLFPFPRKGMCRCKYGECSIGGECPDQRGRLRLYEDDRPYVQPEDFTGPFLVSGLVAGVLAAAAAALACRLRSRPRREAALMSWSPNPKDTDALLQEEVIE
mmetsp:Transcript_35663/g.100253  ORF Transcript_35663/g.100253 Transcript_35663/m.100253 type:complete len:186 (-) Transcript_35663:95-652(-)